jgi:hypothetical protein
MITKDIYLLVKTFQDYLNEMYSGENGVQYSSIVDSEGYETITTQEITSTPITSLVVGETLTIYATVQDIDMVDIEISRDGGQNWSTIVSALSVSHTRIGNQEIYDPVVYNWIVTNPETSLAMFRLKSENNIVSLNELYRIDNSERVIVDTSISNNRISILEKIARIPELKDPDFVDINNIQYLANYLGYNINVNKDEFGIDSDDPNSIDNYLRFMVSNLPTMYKTRTTRNSIKNLLFSFGLIGDIVYYYTQEYSDDGLNWSYADLYFNQRIREDLKRIRGHWYPTPHFAIWYDINRSGINYSYDSTKQQQILNAIESVRPANTVFRGVLGKYTASKTLYAGAVYNLKKSVTVLSTNADYWKV